MGVGPILALISGHFFTQDDRINRWKLVAVLFGFAGVLVLVGGDASGDRRGNGRVVVREVGQDNDFSAILVTDAPGLVYRREALDVTELVIKTFNSKG